MIDENKLTEALKQRIASHEKDADDFKEYDITFDNEETLLRLADECQAIIELVEKQPKAVVATLKFPTMQEMARDLAEKALDEYEYEGKSIRQWVEVLKDYDDKQTTLERIVERLETMMGKPDKLVYEFPLICSIIEIIKEEGLN